MSKRCAVAYDFSEGADRALEWAMELAKCRGDDVTLLHIAPAVRLPPAAAMAPIVLGGGVAIAPKEQAEDLLRLLVEERCPDAGIDVIESPNVGRALVERADAISADLFVIGDHARGSLARALLGSIAAYVVHHAHCPVVVVHEKDARPR